MKKVKEIGTGVFGALCELLVGILLLINPTGFTEAIIVIIGIVLAAVGVINIIRYFRSTPQVGVVERTLSTGILAFEGGCFCICNPQWFVTTFPILTMLYGLFTLVSGVMKVELTFNKVRLKLKSWVWSAVDAAVTLFCAVFIICNPLSTTAALWIFVGISLIVEAILDFVVAFLPSKKDDVINGTATENTAAGEEARY